MKVTHTSVYVEHGDWLITPNPAFDGSRVELGLNSHAENVTMAINMSVEEAAELGKMLLDASKKGKDDE